MKRALIIGGTGMLLQASVDIAKSFDEVVLVSRNPDELALRLKAHAVSMDWSNQESVRKAQSTLKNMGAFDLIVSWIHQDGMWSLQTFEDLLKLNGRSIRVHGTSAGDPSAGIKTDPPSRADITRQNIVLGRKIEKGIQRWLTHEEISKGVSLLVNKPQKLSHVVGKLK